MQTMDSGPSWSRSELDAYLDERYVTRDRHDSSRAPLVEALGRHVGYDPS